MSHISDFTKDSKQIVLDLLNESNAVTFTVDDLNLTFVSEAPAEAARNTILTVTANPVTGYGGEVEINYDRLDVDGFVNGATLHFKANNHLNVSDFIAAVNELLSINLVAGEDYQDAPIGTWNDIPQETKTISVPILEGSLVYSGELTLSVGADDVSLAGTLIVTSLLNWDPLPEAESADITQAFTSTILEDF